MRQRTRTDREAGDELPAELPGPTAVDGAPAGPRVAAATFRGLGVAPREPRDPHPRGARK